MRNSGDRSISEDGNTRNTECSSIHSNDDTQSSIELEDAVIESIIAKIPDTPNTRKSVTFSFSEGCKEYTPTSLVPPSPLGRIMEHNYPATEDGSVVENKIHNYAPHTDSSVEEGDLNQLIPERIAHRPSIVSFVEEFSQLTPTHYMKAWTFILIFTIVMFLLALILWPHSSQSPLLSVVQSAIYPISLRESPSLHVNRTSREILITQHSIQDAYWSTIYSQSFEFLGNSSFDLGHSQARKCSDVVSTHVICCEEMNIRHCYFKDGGKTRNYVIKEDKIIDVEYFQGQMHILKMNWKHNEFVIDNPIGTRSIVVPFHEEYVFKHAFLQSGKLYAYFEHKKECVAQLFCNEVECKRILRARCGVSDVYPAFAANSIVLLHCDPFPDGPSVGLRNTICRLTQLLLPTLATLSQSEAFEITEGRENLIYGFGDNSNASDFHLNRLQLNEKREWELNISTYRMMLLS